MAENKGTSPWIWIGVGCVGLAILMVGGCLGLGFMGYRWAQDVEQTMTDPLAREQKVKELLGTDTLPEGYEPALALDMGVPLLFDMEMAALADRPFDENENHLQERGFWYFKLGGRAGMQKKQELLDFVEGRRNDTDIFDTSNMHFDYEEIVEQGRLDLEDSAVIYSVRSGRVGMAGRLSEALTVLMLIECSEDASSPRLGIWFDREMAGDASLDHEANIHDFLGYFDLCGR